MKFRKKPVVIEAIQWNGAGLQLPLPDWLVAALHKDAPESGAIIRDGNSLNIYTLEGCMRAAPDDWVICGIKGELYPCKPDIFSATYEAV